MHLGHTCTCACRAPAVCQPFVARRSPHTLAFDPLGQRRRPRRAAAAEAAAAESSSSEIDGSDDSGFSGPSPLVSIDSDSASLPETFCIIESPESVKDFAALQCDEIKLNITSRRNKIFLLMEEVRRLRIQLRLRGAREDPGELSVVEEAYPSTIPFFPPVTERTIEVYTRFYALAVLAIIGFGGILAPALEVRLGIGGSSYYDFIAGMHLPTQLAEVDPIVASFCGGGVGVLTSLLIVEKNNAKLQEKRRCVYCKGGGYLTCGLCASRGTVNGAPCANCAGTGKVMCTSCLCTGKKLATEHDPRVDPFTLAG